MPNSLCACFKFKRLKQNKKHNVIKAEDESKEW